MIVFFLLFFFLNSIPFQHYYSPTFHHGITIIYYIFFPKCKEYIWESQEQCHYEK